MTAQLSKKRAARQAALEAAGHKCAGCGHESKSGKGLAVVGGRMLCVQCREGIQAPRMVDLTAGNKDWYAWVYGGSRNPKI